MVFDDCIGKNAWLFVSYQDGSVFASGPVVVSELGDITFANVPVADTSVYSLVIGEMPEATTDPTPNEPDPTEPEPIIPPTEEVVGPGDDNDDTNAPADDEDEPVQQPGKDADKDIATSALPQAGDENGMLEAGFGLTAGVSALIAAIGARRRKERE